MRLRAIALWAPLGIAVAWAGACGVTQPLPQCTIGRGDNAVRYTLVTGTGACAAKTAELVGAQAFRVSGSGVPPTLALEPRPLALLKGQDPDPGHTPYSSGVFSTDYPAADGFCTVDSTSVAEQAVPASGTTAAQDLKYQWSNVRIYGSTAIPGTQWTADVTYTDGDCTATYKAVGVFPAITCKADSDCHAPHPGLALDPAFPVTCEPTSGLCVLAGEPPALSSASP